MTEKERLQIFQEASRLARAAFALAAIAFSVSGTVAAVCLL